MLWNLFFISLISLGRLHLHATAIDTCNTQNEIPLRELNTSQSSNYADTSGVPYVSGRAIDEHKKKCSHTIKEDNSWWTIDLDRVYNISCISIYNIQQKNIVMNDVQIRIGNSSVKNGTENKVRKNITSFELDVYNCFKFDPAVSGRYVTLYSPKTNHVVLCEVKIYEATDSNFRLVEESMTWEDALYYCRDRHKDLASILNNETQTELAKLAKNATTDFVWLGLRYTCTLNFWFWVDDNRLDFEHWNENDKTEECDMSAAMAKSGNQNWFSKPDYETYNFICAK
ncbi:fucolectin-5-like isoform X3 [Thunnus maccoyii]|nr:fucolectin-5-like isoform X3 [Thunnus maccoyii]